MKNIGMLVAVEIQTVLDRYGESVESIRLPGYTVHKYHMKNFDLFVLNCGAGEIAAAAGTQLLITQFQVEMVVNFGVVGGLTEEMAPAKTCIVGGVVHYDFDTSAADHCEVGRYLNEPSVVIPADAAVVKDALRCCPDLKEVVCASGDKFIADKKQKQFLHDTFGADICEMEAAGIVLTCNRNHVPCLLIKCVSDGITGGVEEFEREKYRSAEVCLRITGKIIDRLSSAPGPVDRL